MCFPEAFSAAESDVTSSWTFNVKGFIRVSTAVSIVCAIRAWISNGLWRVVWLWIKSVVILVLIYLIY